MNTLVIYGHPDPQSFCHALADAYVAGALQSEKSVRRLVLAELEFNPNLAFGYRQRTELEPDLLHAQEDLRWADHLVWVYPVWWGSVPALCKGFMDRTLLPGFAFTKRPDSLWWDRHFTGKTARIICTMNQPPWYYRLRYGRPSTRALREVTLQFIGVRKVRTTSIGPVRLSKPEWREKWLNRVRLLGENLQ